MSSHPAGPFANVGLHHVEWYVADAEAGAQEFIDRYGFERHASRGDRSGGSEAYSVLLRQGEITLLITETTHDHHPAARYVQQHGDGVADIALRVDDAAEAYAAAVRVGAVPIAPPAEIAEGWVMARVQGFGDVAHTLIQRPPGASQFLPGFLPAERSHAGHRQDLMVLDHFAVSLPNGELGSTVRFYEDAFGFQAVFEERIEVGAQAMDSVVVQSTSRDVTLVLIEPDTETEAGQIDDFLKSHGGSGVQHLAFTTPDIVKSVADIQSRGVEFLPAPAPYYERLSARMNVQQHDVDDLRRLNILVDEDHDGQLFQIFTRSTHPRRTVFLELIQRIGATTFGSGNIKALYEAVECSRIQAESL
ncbi:4-hydroxyphenylpyruvate dioxygenase [Micromonospora echinospora]|uniref:4-hydroxyphenylpyruvate dioxygenase n=1 Tax=Micromonospora echinospora TaxID=1877 RepID=UPI00344095B4